MLALDTLLGNLPARADGGTLLTGFVPPPRFSDKSFSSYVPDPRHPSQAAAARRLGEIAAELRASARRGRGLLGGLFRRPRGSGVYLDGGFGVGKTHLLAALWSAAPGPSAYLSFDELVYTLGLLGIDGAREAFRGVHLVAVDEWELDDPGNLRLALAFLRGVLADGARVAATSNTVPDELGRGRFDQKSFAAEVEELAASFETVRIEGEDFRHRRFQADPGRAYFLSAGEMEEAAREAPPRAVRAGFDALLAAIAEVHPIRYHALAEAVDALLVDGVRPVADMLEGLRWVHFVDKLYDNAVPLAATSGVALGALFPPSFLAGAYGKKFSRCLSRLEEMLGEARASLPPDAGGG